MGYYTLEFGLSTQGHPEPSVFGKHGVKKSGLCQEWLVGTRLLMETHTHTHTDMDTYTLRIGSVENNEYTLFSSSFHLVGHQQQLLLCPAEGLFAGRKQI